MAKGDWWFKFDIKAWRNSPELRSCSLATRGFWTDCIAIMRHSGQATLTDTVENLARSIGCFPSEAEACIEELKQTKTADVTLRNGRVTLKSRKYAKEIRAKELSNLRVKRHRKKQNVTPEKRLLVISNKKEVRKEEESVCINAGVNVAESEFTEKALAEIRNRLKVNVLPKESLWSDAAIFAMVNGFSVDQFAECFDLLRKQHWRTGPVTPDVMQTNLPNIENLRREIEEQNAPNSKKTNTGTQHRGRVPAKQPDRPEETTEDFLASIGAKPLV